MPPAAPSGDGHAPCPAGLEGLAVGPQAPEGAGPVRGSARAQTKRYFRDTSLRWIVLGKGRRLPNGWRGGRGAGQLKAGLAHLLLARKARRSPTR